MPYLPTSFGYVLRFMHILQTFSLAATPPTPPPEDRYTCFSLFKYKFIIKYARSNHPCPFWPLSFCILMLFFKATHSPTCSMTCPLVTSDFFKLCWPLIHQTSFHCVHKLVSHCLCNHLKSTKILFLSGLQHLFGTQCEALY